MGEMVTTYDGDLKVFTNDEEWVIARSAEDARSVRDEEGGESYDDETWEECPAGKRFTLHDEELEQPDVTKTFAEWAKRGRGYLGSSNY